MRAPAVWRNTLAIPVIRAAGNPSTRRKAMALADEIGYPVMLKAAAGGGGRGMRRVSGGDEMTDAFARCRSEAAAALADGALFLERLLTRPAHRSAGAGGCVG
ncbi:MAG: hypothetical protein U5J89_12460 [Fodinibius sp.]|nr:hypothetical protein [Fodinibius sp.]MDZ7660084.1 hypothetical protein [Fodinibius sp.]